MDIGYKMMDTVTKKNNKECRKRINKAIKGIIKSFWFLWCWRCHCWAETSEFCLWSNKSYADTHKTSDCLHPDRESFL